MLTVLYYLYFIVTNDQEISFEDNVGHNVFFYELYILLQYILII